MPVYRPSRSVYGKTNSTSLSVAGTAYPRHCYDHHRHYHYPADDSIVSDGRSSYVYSHCTPTTTSSASASARLSRSQSASSLRKSGAHSTITNSSTSKSHKNRRPHHNYYDYYDYHDSTVTNENVVDTPLHTEKDDLASYTPVYSVALRDVVRHRYDGRRCAYVSTTATTATRTVRKQFRDCGHDHVAMAIRCAQRTQEVVRAFVEAVDMHGYSMSVGVPTESKTTVTMTEYHRVPKKKQIKQKRTSNTPLHDLLYANGHGSAAIMQQHKSAYYYDYDDYDDSDEEDEEEQETQAYKVKKTVPALVEYVVPGTHTYVCNSGWVRPIEHHGHRRSIAERLIVALPHFSFHWSGGEFMVGSLRAAIDRESRHITISGPTLMSQLGEVYGVEDIGMKGIRNFFYWNKNGGSGNVGRGFETPDKAKMYYEATPRNIAWC